MAKLPIERGRLHAWLTYRRTMGRSQQAASGSTGAVAQPNQLKKLTCVRIEPRGLSNYERDASTCAIQLPAGPAMVPFVSGPALTATNGRRTWTFCVPRHLRWPVDV